MSDFTTHSTIAWQGQTRLPACLSGAFCPFRLGLRQPRSKGTSLGSIGENMPTQQACVSKTKNHTKTRRWQVRGSFAGAEMCPDKKRPAENTCHIVKGLDAVWAHFCPSKPCLPLSSDGSVSTNRLPLHPGFLCISEKCGCPLDGNGKKAYNQCIS